MMLEILFGAIKVCSSKNMDIFLSGWRALLRGLSVLPNKKKSCIKIFVDWKGASRSTKSEVSAAS